MRARLCILHCEDQSLHFTSRVRTFWLVLLNSKGCLRVESWCWGYWVCGCIISKKVLTKKYKDARARACVYLSFWGCLVFFHNFELLLTQVWLWVVWDCIQIFLAHCAIIILGIVIWSWVLWQFSFYHLRKRMHLVSERAIEKNPKILCVCFSVLVSFFLFFWASVSLLGEWGDQFEWVYQ